MNETRIGDLRRTRGWTQERLAEESGVAVRTIQRLEAGKDASLETISLIADALGVPVRELFVTVEKEEFETAVGGLDDRKRAQQERRDATTRAYETAFNGVGVLVVLATVVLALTGILGWTWFTWLIIPAYYAGGRYLFRAFFRLVIDPRLDERYPLSSPTRGRGGAAE